LWSKFDEPLRPAHFEVEFGPSTDSRNDEEEVSDDRDRLGSRQPLVIRHGGESLHVRGRVDRVDIGRIAGRTVFNVVDFKTGSRYALRVESVASGETIQLPLYALAVEPLLRADLDAVPWRAGYWAIRKQGFNEKHSLKFHEFVEGRLEPASDWVAVREQLLASIFSLVRGIRNGEFPMHCANQECTGMCDFRTVCRVGQVRALEKTWTPP
jgi:hypothetical protein